MPARHINTRNLLVRMSKYSFISLIIVVIGLCYDPLQESGAQTLFADQQQSKIVGDLFSMDSNGQTVISSPSASFANLEDSSEGITTAQSISPPVQNRPKITVNLGDFTQRLSEDIQVVGNRTSCLNRIERFFESKGKYEQVDPAKIRDIISAEINLLLSQHKNAVAAIVNEAEILAVAHKFNKTLRVNYTDVHRLRNELEGPPGTFTDPSADQTPTSGGAGGGSGGSGFTSTSGGTPVPGPVEWQTPYRSIIMTLDKNFGDLPVNTSMSAIHLPLPIYAGLPEIMNGIAWTEHLDKVFKRNLAQFSHVHHQYYGSHLGFLRTFPAHKWRIPKTDPDLYDARTRPWYPLGAASPKDVVILVDTSGSMTGLRREIAKGVVMEILDTLTSNDYFSVLRFSEVVTPVGLPKCKLRQPAYGATAMFEFCSNFNSLNLRGRHECNVFKKQWESRGQYLRDHPNQVVGVNATYLTDELYLKSIVNVTAEIQDAYLLPATSRNVRYLKGNFSMPTAGIANFTRALMAAFELLQAYNRTLDGSSQCNQAIMLITDGAIRSHEEIFNRFNYPNSPIRMFTYMIGREVGDITPTKAMACNNRGYYARVISLGEVREQVQKYLPVLARPMVLGKQHPLSWTQAYGDETHQVLTDWVLELKRRERARIMLNEERDRLSEVNSTDVISIELTNIAEYDELALVDDELKNRIICENSPASSNDTEEQEQSLEEELDPLGYNELACHWASRKADLLISAVKPVFYNNNSTVYFERILHKNIWTEKETRVRNAQLLGVASVDLRISDIMRLAPAHLLGSNGYAALIGHNGFLLHHPDLRALLEDPFDKQSRLLKPHFASVDLTHVEQVHLRNASDELRFKAELLKLLRLREAAIRRQKGQESMTVKRAFDCRRRPQVRQQTFYYGPLTDTPYSLMLALPSPHGVNRVNAKLELDPRTSGHFQPSPFDLWTVHPEFRYCQLSGRANSNGSLEIMLRVLEAVKEGSAGGIDYLDLTSSLSTQQRMDTQQLASEQIVCDKELFPSLLFDAAATHQTDEQNCGPELNCNRYFGRNDELCSRTPDEMRWKLASIYGLELAYVATRSGLTRVKVFDLSPRTKKLANIFIQRHKKAIEEPWYSRTVDWNMRQQEDGTLISVPFNAYIRLIAKLRQRITQRQIAPNETRANCDPMLETGANEPSESTLTEQPQADDPAPTTDEQQQQPQLPAKTNIINYADYSTFEMLDLLANSSVHISASKTLIAFRGSKQRTPVAVSGLLYDYATFARRFLNTTSLQISTTKQASSSVQTVELCPDGECPNRCGVRNDTIDCLLVDNNGYIIVSEELIHIGRSLIDYDERLMQSLVDRGVFQAINMIDYQAICARNEQTAASSAAQASGANGNGNGANNLPASSAQPIFAGAQSIATSLLGNMASSAIYLWRLLFTAAAYHSLLPDSMLGLNDWLIAQAQAQSSNNNFAGSAQPQLAFLPNKTYLRPCERSITLYEFRLNAKPPSTPSPPEFYATKCGCSAWYVWDPVPRTNLMMLLVNSSAPCRRCPGSTGSVQVTPTPLSSTEAAAAAAAPESRAPEEQICAMLEQDANLFVRRPDTCYVNHPDEAQISLCGGAQSLFAKPTYSLLMFLIISVVLFTFR